MSSLDTARSLQPKLSALRRAIHRHPETSFTEFQTAQLIAETLQSLGIRVRTGVGRTGVLGFLGEGRPCIGIRADMDALPLQELNEVPYRSEVPGKMHACGHDTHTAMALGAAMLLTKKEIPGQVRFLFQPSEEKPDDEGVAGAARMIEDGAMEGVDAVIALHVDPGTRVGDIAVREGINGANEDSFWATIRGQGCHGAYPESGLDPIFLAGQAIMAVHGIVSRRMDPLEPAVVSICTIHGGTEVNIIPEEVRLSGTIRSISEEAQQQLHVELYHALDVVKAWGGEASLDIRLACPATYNEAGIAAFIRQVAGEMLGPEHVLPAGLGMGAEDFGFMTRMVPGAMFALGAGGEYPVHSPRFDIDETALPIGAAILAETARRWLEEKR